MKSSSKKKSVEPALEPIDWTQFGPGLIVGVDEVGRGCLAGPVYAAAVVLKSNDLCEHLTDSKLLSEKRREELAPKIEQAHWSSVAFATVEEIDELNILQASLLAMKRAIIDLEKKMGQPVAHVLVDGHMRIPDLQRKQTPIVKGDLRCAPISAASIVAKVSRDTLMKEIGSRFPTYGFEKHKGYASPVHRKAIAEIGPILTIHRRSFGGVKEYC